MLLNVKLLGSGSSSSTASSVSIEAQSDESVESLKSKLEKELKLGPNCEQKLLFMGKTLQGLSLINALLLHYLRMTIFRWDQLKQLQTDIRIQASFDAQKGV